MGYKINSMILDKILFEQIGPVGQSILKKASLSKAPENIDEMSRFLKAIDKSIQREDFDGIILGKIFYSFVSSIEVRDRKTTSRTFEDVFSGLFGTKSTDLRSRSNPLPTKELLDLDYLCKGLDWKISDDMASNKREKADLILGNYPISLKTLKGYAYDEFDEEMESILIVNGEQVKNDENGEVNMGSFSYRALLKGILTDDELGQLSDRKGGLGSKKQVREFVLNKVKEHKKENDFYNRLSVFLKYVYSDDIYIVLKSNFLITWILIPAESFVEVLLRTYKEDESHFEDIWERWENNNLRMLWHPILKKLDEYKLRHHYIDIFLGKVAKNEEMKMFEGDMTKFVKERLDEIIKKMH